MSVREEIAKYIKKKMIYFANASNPKAELAMLRKGVGHSPGALPELYGILLQDMPESFWNDSGEVTRAEWSCYVALTLYAVHQQGNNIRLHNMHTDRKVNLGGAIGRLSIRSGDKNAEARNLKRLQMLVTSVDMSEFAYHLKSIISLLKNENIALNYIELAKDIYDFQFTNARNRVSLKWGQDYYRVIKEEKKNE